MKLVLIFIFSLSSFISCSAQTSDVLYIGQASNGGIRNSSTLIALNDENILSIQKKYNLNEMSLKKCVIDKASFVTLESYFHQNCNLKNNGNEYTKDLILIKFYSKTNLTSTCYLVDKEKIKPYFLNLIKKTKAISNKSDSKALIAIFENVVNIVNYDIKNAKSN